MARSNWNNPRGEVTSNSMPARSPVPVAVVKAYSEWLENTFIAVFFSGSVSVVFNTDKYVLFCMAHMVWRTGVQAGAHYCLISLCILPVCRYFEWAVGCISCSIETCNVVFTCTAFIALVGSFPPLKF